jgi:hypothetical protein
MPDEHSHGSPRAAGYQALTARFGLTAIHHWHRSTVSMGGVKRVQTSEGVTEACYPSSYWPGDGAGEHLTFALKYDGVNLAILHQVFAQIAPQELAAFIRAKPTSKYNRRIWFLYEFLTGATLDIEDATAGGYVDLLVPDLYVVTNPARQVRRQRINDNLLGTADFCPIIRRTGAIEAWTRVDMTARCTALAKNYPPDLLRRALSFLYTKETKSSFEIERQKPSASRTERFIAMLQLAAKDDFCIKEQLIALQNRIVDPRFQDADYRSSQNYVGETLSWQHERIHYVCPKPEDLARLMHGLVEAHRRMEQGSVHAVAHAAAVAYGFVFLHPFEDGNGRIHRFLIHNVLARRGYTPPGMIFPVSAAMLKSPDQYDASLEAFSKPLVALIDYDLNPSGEMTVRSQTAHLYAYPDMTLQTEALFGFIEETVERELVHELEFITRYDEAKHGIQAIVDLPDRSLDLFIQLCTQNRGHLSERKRTGHFAALSSDEITAMEQVVQEAFSNTIKIDDPADRPQSSND